MQVLCCAVPCWVTQSCLTLCDPMDSSLPGSSVHGKSPGKKAGCPCLPQCKSYWSSKPVFPMWDPQVQATMWCSDPCSMQRLMQSVHPLPCESSAQVCGSCLFYVSTPPTSLPVVPSSCIQLGKIFSASLRSFSQTVALKIVIIFLCLWKEVFPLCYFGHTLSVLSFLELTGKGIVTFEIPSYLQRDNFSVQSQKYMKGTRNSNFYFTVLSYNCKVCLLTILSDIYPQHCSSILLAFLIPMEKNVITRHIITNQKLVPIPKVIVGKNNKAKIAEIISHI